METWGFTKDLNKKVDIKKTREQEGFKLIRYTLKEIAKLWDYDGVTNYFKANPKVEDNFWAMEDSMNKVAREYFVGNIPTKKLKESLEKMYQIVLKVHNKAKEVENDKQLEGIEEF